MQFLFLFLDTSRMFSQNGKSALLPYLTDNNQLISQQVNLVNIDWPVSYVNIKLCSKSVSYTSVKICKYSLFSEDRCEWNGFWLRGFSFYVLFDHRQIHIYISISIRRWCCFYHISYNMIFKRWNFSHFSIQK